MKTKQFNARLDHDTITRIEQLASTIGGRNTPAKDISQADVIRLSVKLLHDNELGQSGKISKKSRQTT